MKKWKNLEDAVKSSLTKKEVLDKLGKFSGGGNYENLTKQIIYYNLDTSHFDSNNIKLKKLKKHNELFGVKKELHECLVENSTYDRGHLKERLYKEGLKNRICEMCGLGEGWYGKKLSLILDHINGVNNDNRIENLRILCPNCNSTLDTHCGKNKTIEKKQKKLKKRLDSFESKRKVKNRPDYEILLIEVNNMGYSATGRKYGVSDNTIRKWLKYYEKYIKK